MPYATSEFSNNINLSNAGYARLGSYNIGTQWTAPQAFAPSMATIVVPSYGAPGYQTLLHDQQYPSGGGYFTIGAAYPENQCSSVRFSERMCS